MPKSPMVTGHEPILPLVLRKVATRRQVPYSVMAQSEVSTWRDPMLASMIVEVSTHVLADKVEEQVIPVRHVVERNEYVSWWQHTKAVHFPTISAWLRRPPRKDTVRLVSIQHVTVERWATFPDADAYPLPLGKAVYEQHVYPPWSDDG